MLCAAQAVSQHMPIRRRRKLELSAKDHSYSNLWSTN
jgi:hypothetical protein